jgi:uncharacterized protein YukE
MRAEVLPATQKLIAAFDSASGATKEIASTLQTAEEESSSLFKDWGNA